MSTRKEPPKPAAVPKPPKVDNYELMGATIVETRGSKAIGQSILYFHPNLDLWSARFILQEGGVDTWLAFPNEQIARGAFVAGPPYLDNHDG
jgi:hypothetical protein